MSEKFVVGQWVVSDTRVGVYRVAEVHHGGTLKVDVAGGGWSPQEIWRPFLWQVGKTYRTTLDGVTATVDRVSCDRVWVACKWHHATEQIYANNFHEGTGRLLGFENRDDVPHLLPYLADEPQPVAEAATFSEFEEAGECDEPDALQSLLAEFVAERNLCDEQIATWQVKRAEWLVAIRKTEQAIEMAKR